MNQTELLEATGNGETIHEYGLSHGLSTCQIEGLAQYVTSPRTMASVEVVIDESRVLFVHGRCSDFEAIAAVNGTPTPGCRFQVSRAPHCEMYSVHVITKLVPV